MTRLSLATVPVKLRPAYLAPAAVGGVRPAVGMVHLGPGAFFRGHQAWYTEQALRLSHADGNLQNWSICAVSMRSADVATALNPQDGLYVLAQMEQHTELSVIGALAEVLQAPSQYDVVLSRLQSSDCQLVSMTITEKGYCLAASGELDLQHPDIRADLALTDVWQQARSAIGLLTAGLYLRFLQRLPMLVLFSCDNLTDNGHKLKAAVRQFAAHCPLYADNVDFLLALTDLVCPCSMVDSITPATDDALRQAVSAELAVSDAWPVKREAFCQWVIEDVLPPSLQLLRHYWQQAGVIFTPDVTAFEKAKLRLLNAPHSTMAYLGCLLQLETVLDAMQHPHLCQLLQQLVNDEILPTVPAVAGLDLAAYSQAIFQRFCNPQVRHLLAQIAWDGSQKLQMRILPVIRDNLANNQPVTLLALAVAAWLQFIRLRQADRSVPFTDPLAPVLLATAAQCTGDAATDIPLWLALDQVFSTDLIAQTAFVSPLWQAYQWLTPLLAQRGSAEAASQFFARVGALPARAETPAVQALSSLQVTPLPQLTGTP